MSWFNWFGGKSQLAVRNLVIHLENKELKLSFTQDDTYDDVNVRLGALRVKLADYFNADPEDVLLFQLTPRRKLTDDNKALGDFGIENGDHLYAKLKAARKSPAGKAASGPNPASPSKAPKAPLTPKQQLEAAEEAVDKTLGARIEAFIANPPTTKKELETEFLVLSETVLQNIIKLDNVEVAGNEELRQHRRGIITRFNKYHEQIDKANARGLEAIEKAGKTGTEQSTNHKHKSDNNDKTDSPKPKRKHKNKHKNKSQA